MTACSKCKNELADGVEFCGVCGQMVSKRIFCQHCGKEMNAEAGFCGACGGRNHYYMEQHPEQHPEVHVPKSHKKPVVLGIGVAVVAVVIIVGVLLFTGKFADNTESVAGGLYLKEEEIYYTDFSEDGEIELTSSFAQGNDIIFDDLEDVEMYICISEDGKRVFFPDKLEGGALNLYYRDTTKSSNESEKIDSDIYQYVINETGTKIAYIKGTEGNLYISDLEDKEKITSGAYYILALEDLSRILYITAESEVYLWTEEGETTKIASDISKLQYISEDLSTIYYEKDNSIYVYDMASGDNEKIASDIYSVTAIYETGEVYYTKKTAVKIDLSSYVYDDMAQSDSEWVEPEDPDDLEVPGSPMGFGGSNDITLEEHEAQWAQYNLDLDEYSATYAQMKEAYEAAWAAYEEIGERDALREELAASTENYNTYTLYYYDGNKETMVSEALVYENAVAFSDETATIFINIYDEFDIPQVNLSEIDCVDDVENTIEDIINDSYETYLVIGTSLTKMEGNPEMYRVSTDGSEIYYLEDVSEDGYGRLYKLTITDETIDEPVFVDDEVSNMAMSFLDNGSFVYYKNVVEIDDRYDFDYKDQWYLNCEGDLYLDGVAIDYEVRLDSVSNNEENGVYYYTDWNSEKVCGTLKFFVDGEKLTIADEVVDYYMIDEGVQYLYDYSLTYYTGALYLYKDEESVKIDDDVIGLLSVEEAKELYGWEDRYGICWNYMAQESVTSEATTTIDEAVTEADSE